MSISDLAEQLAAEQSSAKARAYALQDIQNFAEAMAARGFAVGLEQRWPGGQVVLSVDLDSLTLPDLPASVEDAPGKRVDAALPVTKPVTFKAPEIARNILIGNGRWTEDDDARLIEMKAQGKTYVEIGAALGRTEKAVGLRIVKLNKAARAAGPAPKPDPALAAAAASSSAADEAEAAAVQADPGPVVAETIAAVQDPAPVAPEVEMPPRPVNAKERGPYDVALPGLSDAEQQVELRLRKIGYSGGMFSPASDMALVTVLARGDGISAAAEAAKLTQIDARARWRALLPEVTIEGQQALLSVLRKRHILWSEGTA